MDSAKIKQTKKQQDKNTYITQDRCGQPVPELVLYTLQ